MKKILALVLAGCSLLWGGVDDSRYSEIRLQGELSFADIVNETESQLGISIRLPSKVDKGATEKYNHIISLRQLVDAVIAHYAQDDIPLDWKFEAKSLSFYRRDVVSSQKNVAKRNENSSSQKVAEQKYPVPVIHEPAAPPKEQPHLPDWMVNRETETHLPREIPQRSPTQNPMSLDDLDDLPSIPSSRPSQNSEDVFSIRIPVSAANGTPKIKVMPELRSPSQIPPQDLPDEVRSQPSMPTIRNHAPQVETKKGVNFGIAPYPEDAVAFINDAPSIVPGAARENYVEWSARMEGLLINNHRNALLQEIKDLERRLRWLKDRL